MQIKSIAAKNYRTLQDTTLTFSNNYCTISGKNNAGKSCVIRLLSALFRPGPSYPWAPDEGGFDYKDDRTQWCDGAPPISVTYELLLTKAEDPALISFIEKISTISIAAENIVITVNYTLTENDNLSVSVTVGDKNTDDTAAKEIDKRIKDSNLLFLYNSTIRQEEFYFGRGRHRMFYEFVMSEDEKKELEEASKQVEKRMRKLANEHKLGLNGILGRLTESYDVEFSPLERSSARRMPLGINLKDKHVEVPLNDWGSGTQNRTHILMAVLQANRIKTTESSDDKITPFVVIEEPESFLHPAAQAEFGRLLRTLSGELGIQILVTTHSPYMLNQELPGSNILLARKIHRNKYFDSCVVDTSGDNWMAPFAEHMGIAPTEFMSWRPVFSSYKSKVLLVEGPIDKQYFEFLQKHGLGIEPLSADVEVVPYGGKDTLKNTLLVQFVLKKFDHVFVTYDLDADNEIKNALHRLELKEGRDYLALGINQPGKDCIEGVLPQCVLATVMGKETDLVMKLGSRENSDRRKAKDALKHKYLEEFKSRTDYGKEELKELSKIIRTINVKLM